MEDRVQFVACELGVGILDQIDDQVPVRGSPG
jgi:hypothetical protein